MQTIKQQNEKIRILQKYIATKDASNTTLKNALNDCSNVTILPAEPSVVIVVPNSDEFVPRGKFVKI